MKPCPAAGVPDTPMDQEHAFLVLVDRLVDATEEDVTRITNAEWLKVFGIYWHLKELLGDYAWRHHWDQLKAHILSRSGRQNWDPDNTRLELWAWFTEAMNWRREYVRQRSGREARRWKQTKADPQRHAKAKTRNAAAQRKRRTVTVEPSEDLPWEAPSAHWEDEAAQ